MDIPKYVINIFLIYHQFTQLAAHEFFSCFVNTACGYQRLQSPFLGIRHSLTFTLGSETPLQIIPYSVLIAVHLLRRFVEKNYLNPL